MGEGEVVGHNKTQNSVPSVIVDNRDRKVGDFLREHIREGADLSIVSAWFTIYAYDRLCDVLDHPSTVRFLYGDPHGAGEMDPDTGEARSFRLTGDGGIVLRHTLAQKALARACAEWIERKVEVRTIKRAGFLHGKLYHVADGGGDAALCGSSNFTRRGLGYGAAPNVELNLEVGDKTARQSLIDWFNDLWDDPDLTEDVKANVLEALGRLGAAQTPEFIYYKTLFHVFADRLAGQTEQDELFQDIHLFDTAVWKALYKYQRDGAVSAINRLRRHNGCIIADSVGLGKTWTALAVIKFFELRNEQVLVLCPKRLQANWTRYVSRAAHRANPFEKDRLSYTVLAHTDLSRYGGEHGDINFHRFNWGAFDLIVIDESHNFRNEGRDRTNEAGTVVRRSRYNRLLEEAIKEGVSTKLLMLSATPVNTSLRDLRNQIYLMTEKRQDAFRESLGIGDIQTLFGVAQREFQQWEQGRRRGDPTDKNVLIERLGADFLTLLDSVTLARSRDHLRRFYPAVTAEIGGFPERATPENLHPPTDREGDFSYDELHQQIDRFQLAVYNPSKYVKDTTELDMEKKRLRFDQRDREYWLIGMMRVNLLKRLESSVDAFRLTVQRILERMSEIEHKIEASEHSRQSDTSDVQPHEDEEDEEFTIGKRHTYRLDELDLDQWRKHLRADRELFENIYSRAERVTVDRDAKLAKLKELLQRKIVEAPTDKDGHPNRKVLVFTTFSDTARYLYRNLVESGIHEKPGIHLALVTGGDGNQSTAGITDFDLILRQFAPRAQNWGDSEGRGEDGNHIDILIATDCLSEGQNLQDCDLVVNYDIHWNPVRLMQRFGRIDRLGSRNRKIGMINFWPTEDLDRYLDLKNRVEARMALVDVTATGDDDPLDKENPTEEGQKNAAQLELSFRDKQLKRVYNESLDAENVDDGMTMSDLTLDDFLADLLQYIQRHRAALEAAPFGIYAVASSRAIGDSSPPRDSEPARPGAGVIFCLRHKSETTERTPNRLWPYFLVYVHDDGNVRYTFLQAQQCLALFRELAVGHSKVATALENAFDRDTCQGRSMEKYDTLLEAALKSIAMTFNKEQRKFGLSRDGKLAKEQPADAEGFELITWLVIADEDAKTGDGAEIDA